jgi:organic radical activating enzyme
MEDNMLYSEIFKSLAGEGHYTGYPSLWLRTFYCNLTCAGFGQPDPTNKETYNPVGKDVNLIDIKDITDLPVFKYGCDSAYSVAKEFKHLQYDETPEQIAERLDALLPTHGVWSNEDYDFHMVFTGGEPLLKKTQKGLVELFDLWSRREDGSRPKFITFETNGTQKITPELAQRLNSSWIEEVLFSYSPKLFTVSGESNKRAVKPEIIQHNIDAVDRSAYTLKFVVNGQDAAWNELDDVINQIGLGKKHVWIMAVGGRVEDQELSAGDIANRAIDQGYKVSARVHSYLWGNTPGT